jgi:hypothetical protein
MPKGFAGGHRNRPACCGGKNGKRFPERGKSFRANKPKGTEPNFHGRHPRATCRLFSCRGFTRRALKRKRPQLSQSRGLGRGWGLKYQKAVLGAPASKRFLQAWIVSPAFLAALALEHADGFARMGIPYLPDQRRGSTHLSFSVFARIHI